MKTTQQATMHDSSNSRREERAAWAPPKAGHLPQLALRFPKEQDLRVNALRNVSNSGASLLIARPLPSGTMTSVVLTVQQATMAFVARVVWCRRADGGDVPLTGPGHLDGVTEEPLFAVGLHVLGPGSFAAMVDTASHL
jgi:hypothetical protein